MDRNKLAGLEQDGVENRIIWNGIMQDGHTWDMIRRQEEELY